MKTVTDSDILNLSMMTDYSSVHEIFNEYQANRMNFENNELEIKFLYECGSAFQEERHLVRQVIHPMTDDDYLSEYCYLLLQHKFELLNKQKQAEIINVYLRSVTNLGANYADAFRTSSAIQMFTKALKHDDHFDVAISGLLFAIDRHYTMFDYHGHAELFNYMFQLVQQFDTNRAKKVAAAELGSYFEGLKEHFENLKESFMKQSWYDPYAKFELMSKNNSFKYWSCRNTLFLNNLNDLGAFRQASFDIDLSNLLSKEFLESTVGGWLNSLIVSYQRSRKQVFILKQSRKADIEGVQREFIWLYGFFDKAAYIINKYFKLGIKDEKVNFYSIWNSERIQQIPNTFLHDLFWLQKEEKNHRYNGLISPDAIKMDLVRNIIEHRHIVSTTENGEISYTKLIGVSIHLLLVIRHMLMSLVGTIYVEEQSSDIPEKKRLIKMSEFDLY
ncbi:hypothetical protein FC89_GL001432 [Liquorilactobacillus ghanensis DSM 18630]|uniref:LA2681-like HEPN domain-containing protein n=1 Tax=Liquorilactobacillus ghanensis DSM 18630 TaxID=1423750 RepID=A0A0R1VKD0_9LACO|nr:LA2681 family HEPN domain-containing protein [Liquorilactobacillus ghanensis]KRM05725.1 hypothetical protein FC89_GL001432 [Liquorilactobacillus ghanensis DSM 18630]